MDLGILKGIWKYVVLGIYGVKRCLILFIL